MNRSEQPLIPIKADDYKAYKDDMTVFLKEVQWSPDQRTAKNAEIDLTFLIQNKGLGVNQTDSISILKNAVRLSKDRILLSNATSFVMNTLRDGLCIGKHVATSFEKSSGLDVLLQRNKDGALHQSELPEFHDKLSTQSAVLLFVAAYYIVYKLNNYETDVVTSINIDFGGIPELKLSRPSSAISNALYYYGAYIERSNTVNNDMELVKMTLLYFEALLEEIQMRKGALSFTEFYTNVHYKLEGTDFILDGFESTFSAAATSIQFNKTKMEDIVANHDAKHMFKRFAERLLCHDVTVGKNPMLELGGLPSITMADGKPGTGKSMLIAATATMIAERCEWLDIPFLFWPLPENIISTFQGGSAERAIEWFRPMQDASKIIFAPIDDAENNLEERTRQGVSAGVRELIGVFLRNTEGAYAINNGNRLISLFTNIPDQIDKAVLSRIQYRVSMDGAVTKEDFIDQDFIWWRKYKEMMPDFVDAKDPKSYNYMDFQKEVRSLAELESGPYEFKIDDIQAIYNDAEQHFDPTDHEFFGAFYQKILQRYPFFSSRDLRNIQKAVDARIIDFDLPEVWWDNPETFFRQDYDTKLNMLKELTKSNLGSLSFSELRLREALNYIETAVRINETGINRDIKETAKRMFISEEASKQIRNGEISF
ncbi:MAG: ATP-binding protein [Saprospiraceae bacterium]|nr:ATP-binding protein [Saprospiraceae bacterium]